VTDLDAIRRDLETHRDESRKRIATLAKRPERGTAQGFGKRIGDGTVEAISRLTEIGVGTSLEVDLERTERALAKLDEGTYGLCDACGKPIAPKRLQAMPNVVLCIECAAAQPRAAAPRRRSRCSLIAFRSRWRTSSIRPISSSTSSCSACRWRPASAS